MEQNFFKRILALLLCLVMAFSTVSTALATGSDDDKEINYISFGDSMTNGLAHENYEVSGESRNVNGFRRNNVTTIYPYMLASYLADPDGDGSDEYTVNYEQMAISTMRPEDINFLLRFDTTDDACII